MHLVLKTRAELRAVYPVYPESVCRALIAIRNADSAAQEAEREKLDAAEREDLADGLQLLAVAKMLEAQLAVIEKAIARSLVLKT